MFLKDRLICSFTLSVSYTHLYHFKKVGIVTTGSEVKKGLIQDTFTPVLKEKLSEYPTEVIGQTTPGDDKAQITDDIMEFINQGADMVVCSGGMSVDPDDRTPGGIRDTGARVAVSYTHLDVYKRQEFMRTMQQPQK